MEIDSDIILAAVQFLLDGEEKEAANLLRSCTLESIEIVDSWMDGSRKLDGLLIEVSCPRSTYEVITERSHPLTKSIEKAMGAVLPKETYLKSLQVRATSVRMELSKKIPAKLSPSEGKQLADAIETQKSLMIAVATGGPRINEVNREYVERRLHIGEQLQMVGLEDPNPFPDLWTWYGRWSDGSLPTYQSRRRFVTDLYQPLLDALLMSRTEVVRPVEPTGWARVDRNIEKIAGAMEAAKNPEDFQTVALLCREAIISLAQAVYKAEEHGSEDGVRPSDTDAKRMLENYLASQLSGQSNENHRKFAKASFDLAVSLQHRRTATFRDAALCVEATRSIINTIAIVSGQRDPEK